jgi:hypothetical protein
VFTQPWRAGPSSKRRDQMIYYQYGADRARRTLRGIDEQVAKAARAVAGLAPVKREPVHRPRRRGEKRQPRTGGKGTAPGWAEGLHHQPRRLPRRRTPVTADFVIGSYHDLWKRREEFPHVKVRPKGPARLPSQEDPLPPDLRDALALIKQPEQGAH